MKIKSYKEDIYSSNPDIFFILFVAVIIIFVILIFILTYFDSINSNRKCKEIYGEDYSLVRIYRSSDMCKDKEGNLKLLNK